MKTVFLRGCFRSAGELILSKSLWVIFLTCGFIVGIYEMIRWIGPVDFLVYYYAGATALDGGSVYGDVVSGPRLGDGLPYNYGPGPLLLFGALSRLNIDVAFILWSLVQMVLLAVTFGWIVPDGPRKTRAVILWLLAFTPASVLAQQDLWGQINILMMFACLASLRSQVENRGLLWAGLGVGLAAATKLTPGIFAVHQLIVGRWKTALSCGLGFLAVTAISGIFFPGDVIRFFQGTIWDLTSRVSLGKFFSTSGNNSIQGAAAYLGAPHPLAIAITVVAMVAALWLAKRAYSAKSPLPSLIIVGLAAPLASPVSWIHHFIYVLPALVYVWHYAPALRKPLVVPIILLMWIQATDLGGHLADNGWPAVWPLAVFLRESLLLTSIALIWSLYWIGKNHSKPIFTQDKPAQSTQLALTRSVHG